MLGANDGLVSNGCLLIGVAMAASSHRQILLTGFAGLVAGAMSMAAGEYVSVHSQADTENADLTQEKAELKNDPSGEHRELAAIYVERGIEPSLAKEVAEELMAHDALGAHARDELGISSAMKARPFQAALVSAASFSAGASVPVAVAALVSVPWLTIAVGATSMVFLALLGSIAAKLGGAPIWIAAWRVTSWGVLAMIVTASAGALFGAVV